MQGKIDPLDLVAMPIFLIGGALSLGLVDSFTIMGIDPTSTVVSLGPETSITWVTLVMLGAFGVVLATNDWSMDAWGTINGYLAVVTFILIISPPLVPAIETLLGSSTIAALFAFTLQTAGYTAVSYAG